MHRQRPRLRNGVDIQLQSAFSDGNWPLVVQLSEKRARSFKDEYYDVSVIHDTCLEHGQVTDNFAFPRCSEYAQRASSMIPSPSLPL